MIRAGARPGFEVRQEALWLVLEIGALGWDFKGAGPEFSHPSNGLIAGFLHED